MASTQIPLRLSLGRRQVEVDVHRVKNDVRRPVHFRRGRRLAVVASRWTSLRADNSSVSDDGEVTRRRYVAVVQ